jgi:hypothetical protein
MPSYLLVIHLYHARTYDASSASNQSSSCPLYLLGATGVIAVLGDYITAGGGSGVSLLAVIKGYPVADSPKFMCPLNQVANFGRPQHCLTGHTGEIWALAAHKPFFNQRNRFASGC